jgi:exosortase
MATSILPERRVVNRLTKPVALDHTTSVVLLAVSLAVLIAAYWNTLTRAALYWDNPKYSHGYLVPMFTAVLLWMRREVMKPMELLGYIGSGLMGFGLALGLLRYALIEWASLSRVLDDGMGFLAVVTLVSGAALFIGEFVDFSKVTSSARWAGVGLVALGVVMRGAATYYPNVTPEMYSFVPAVAGLFLLIGGWPVFKWSAPAVGFLIFMFPLPGFLDTGLLRPLQGLATRASTYFLQTLGASAYSEGNTIFVGDVHMGVVEQCSGLRMLTMMVALSVAFTLVTNRPIWERIVIVLSSVPIALAVNIIRITVTGIMHLTVGPELANKIFHDLAGWVMMPMALGFLYVEFQILTHLFIEEDLGPMSIGLGGGQKISVAK